MVPNNYSIFFNAGKKTQRKTIAALLYLSQYVHPDKPEKCAKPLTSLFTLHNHTPQILNSLFKVELHIKLLI